jgi:hypothetical protein
VVAVSADAPDEPGFELFADELPSSLAELGAEPLAPEYSAAAGASTVSTASSVSSLTCPSTAATLTTVSSIRP